jgi:phytoene dehydrogenase-like protein
LVGASAGIGHKLRDGLRAEVPDDKWQDRRVVIVGAGMAGLSAARQLRKKGVEDFSILELEPKPGGTSQFGSRKDAVVSYPWGAHCLPVPTRENPDLVDLLEEMGILEGRSDEGDPIVAEMFLCRDPQERIYYEGHWYEELYPGVDATTEYLRQFAAFQTEIDRWAGWRDAKGRRAFTLPRAKSSDDAELTALDRFTMAEWMDRQGLTSQKLRWWVDFACRDDYGLRLHQTSAWAGLFYFASRKPEPGKPSQPFITWPEGNGRIVKHLTSGIQDRLETGWAVLDVNPVERNGKAGVDVVAVNHAGTDARGFHAERVIFAAPQFLAPYIIRPYREQPPEHVKAFQYGSWAVANLILKDRPAEDEEDYPLCWDNVFYDSPSLGYVAATHQRGLDYGPSVFTW